jgi:hypothetical protein
MTLRSYVRMLLIVAAAGMAANRGAAADPKVKQQSTLSNLSLEVTALQSISRFQMTPQQITALRRMAQDMGGKSAPRDSGKGSEKLRQIFSDLRDALIRSDEDRILELENQLSDQLDAEEYELDDAITITAAARRRTPELLQILTPKQVNAFLSDSSEDLPDPLALLLEALEVVGKSTDAEWKERVEFTAEELSWQLGGLDADRNRLVTTKVEQFLKKMRSLSAKDFANQRPALEQNARMFVAQVPPTLVLHNYAEHTLAELLSNPRTVAAVDAQQMK